jgi:hypothetical protein
MPKSRGSAVFALVALAALLHGAASPALAQSSQAGKWEVDFHGGGVWSSNSTAGAAATLPVGEAFPTLFGRTSRRVSSWFFGDGAALLNSVNTELRAVNGQITPLDGVLGAAAATRGTGGGVGFRLARRFGARYAAEFSFDYAAVPLEFTSKSLEGIEASRNTFINSWRALFATGPFTVNSVTATKDLTESTGHQLQSTGVLTVDLVTHGRFVPYVAGGAGVVTNQGDAPAATLKGNYTVAIVGTFPINETDTVTVRIAPRSHETVGVFGGGVRYAVSPRWGIRADVRALAGGGKVDTIVDASPSVATQTPATFISSATSPSVQFSNNPITNQPSSLSGPAINGLKTFTGSGSAIRTNVAAGVYLRF